jgi:hypothetical protein
VRLPGACPRTGPQPPPRCCLHTLPQAPTSCAGSSDQRRWPAGKRAEVSGTRIGSLGTGDPFLGDAPSLWAAAAPSSPTYCRYSLSGTAGFGRGVQREGTSGGVRQGGSFSQLLRRQEGAYCSVVTPGVSRTLVQHTKAVSHQRRGERHVKRLTGVVVHELPECCEVALEHRGLCARFLLQRVVAATRSGRKK